VGYQAGPAWTHNILLFDSAAAYVDSIDDKEVLADLALNRAPQFPVLAEGLRSGRMAELFGLWCGSQAMRSGCNDQRPQQ
jgi:hypothetical protein